MGGTVVVVGAGVVVVGARVLLVGVDAAVEVPVPPPHPAMSTAHTTATANLAWRCGG